MTPREQIFYWILGNAIMRARKSAQLTQAALGEQASLSRASIANIECGRQVVQLHSLVAISGALGVEIAGLIPNGRVKR